MPKRLTKKQQMQRLGAGILNIRDHGKPMAGRKDGGIGTKPTVPCVDQLEADVTTECNDWLTAHGVMYDRNNTGVGDIDGTGRKFTYGIIGGGDIIGCLPCGRHIEIEYKRGKGGTLSLDQQKRERKVNRHNGVYLVVHGLNELIFTMKGLL